jgi:hypothetical protein
MKTTSLSSGGDLAPNISAKRGQRSPLSFLRDLWCEFGSFLIDKSVPTPCAGSCAYDKKVRFYPYLPASEEQRDWLEKSFHNPNTHF